MIFSSGWPEMGETMLNTDNRQLLLSSLRPPMGYRFDRGVGTTYTLDLLSLMVAPLALALVDFDGLDSALRDPLILMESLRRVAGRLTLFCQAGGIYVPAKQNLLFHYLEDRVIEVNKKGGVFHPKVWVLRYFAEGLPPLYRLLVLSRNLTFDRSWDLMLQLEGEVDEGRTLGIRSNDPLARFLAELPNLALREVNEEIRSDLSAIEREIRRVRWTTPEPFEGEPVFLPIGIPRHRTLPLDEAYQRLMVISPFLQDRLLQDWAKKGSDHVLISRADSLDDLSDRTLALFKNITVLQDPVDDVPEDNNGNEMASEQPIRQSTDLSGLHAKLVVWEKGRNASWLIGSANATENGFGGRNVEFMVGLTGPRRLIGINAILGLNGEKTDYPLSALLQPYRFIQGEELDASQKKAEKLAEQLLAWLINAEMHLTIQTGEAGYDLLLSTVYSEAPPKGEFQVVCWPINLTESAMLPLVLDNPAPPVRFLNLSLLALTRFIAFEITASAEGASFERRFVLTLPVSGMPEGRDERVVSEIITNQAQFLRYLRLLLGQAGAEDTDDGLAGVNLEEVTILKQSHWELGELDLLENLVRTISRAPDRIDRIAEIVEDLNRTPEGRRALPPDFINLWKTIAAWRAENQPEGEEVYDR